MKSCSCMICNFAVCALVVLFGFSTVFADITYSLHLGGVDAGIAAQITASVQEAVELYNEHGSFNKHLNIYYNSGVPTAQASYTGTIEFGGSRNTRVALHEISHTLGVGQVSAWSANLSGGVWQGYYGRTRAIEQGSEYADGLHGDSQHYWPWGLNYDSEDGFMNRIYHIRIEAALRCDMGIMAYWKEAEHQIVPLGETAVFTVESPLASSYQWYKSGSPLTNGGDISGATSSTLQIANVDVTDAGNYYCAATGAGETLNSRSRRLIIQGQVGQWDFDGNATDSVGSYDGTTSGSPTYPIDTEIGGQVIELDGTDDRVTLPAGVADTEDITVAAWINWDGGNQWQRIFDFGTSTYQYLFLTPRSGGNTLRFGIKYGGSTQYVETAQLATGQWVHIAAVLKGDAASLYVNGQAVATNSSITIDPRDFNPTINYIGDSQWSADPFFNGRIDDFRIYNSALRGWEIWDLWGQSANNGPEFTSDPIIMPDGGVDIAYTGLTLTDYASDPDSDPLTYSKVSGPAWLSVAADGTLSGTPGDADVGENIVIVRVTDPSGASDDAVVNIFVSGLLTAFYPFEGNYNDMTGNGYDGTAVGTPGFNPAGYSGQALSLSGGSYLTCANSEGLTLANGGTICAWIKTGSLTNPWASVVTKGRWSWRLVRNNETDYISFHFNSPSYEYQANGDIPVVDNTWHHLAATYDETSIKLYVDGVLDAEASTPEAVNESTYQVYIGSRSDNPTGRYWDGLIDEVYIYNYALSSTKISAIAAGNTGEPSFTINPINNLDGIELSDYMGNSLIMYADDPDGIETVAFSKDSGPGWLVVSPDGTLSGIPGDSNVGENTFTVRVTDNGGLYDTTQMTIQVSNVYSGVLGMPDLAGLAAQWLVTGCVDMPACNGADLSGDTNVDILDLDTQAYNWLADESLQLYLTFDETSGDVAYDSSIYQRSGHLVNTPSWDPNGMINGALGFDGTDDYVEITGYKGVTSTAGRTCMAWIKTTASEQGNILSWGAEQPGQKWMFRTESDGTLSVGIWGGYIHTAETVNNGEWRHVAAVLTDDGDPSVDEILLYIDGILQTDATPNTTQSIYTAALQDVIIGMFENGGVPTSYFEGLIDDVRVYDRALSESEVQDITIP